MIQTSRMLFDFLHFVSSPSAFLTLNKYEIGWTEFCQVVRRNISNCLYEFKQKVKNIVTSPQSIPDEAKENLRVLRDHFLAPNLKQLVRGPRSLRTLCHLAWVTICRALGSNTAELGRFDGELSQNVSQYNLVASSSQQRSRSRGASYSRSRSPLAHHHRDKQEMYSALSVGVLSK